MLEVLKRQQLKDTVVVVTRYFGGIKLESGGLIVHMAAQLQKNFRNRNCRSETSPPNKDVTGLHMARESRKRGKTVSLSTKLLFIQKESTYFYMLRAELATFTEWMAEITTIKLKFPWLIKYF